MTEPQPLQRSRIWAPLCLVVAVALLVGACATEDDAAEIVSDATESDPADGAETDGDEAGDGEAGDGEADDGATTTSTASDPNETTSTIGEAAATGNETSTTKVKSVIEPVEVPGEPYDIGPGNGEPLDVIGVAHDDVLNFRTSPDAASPIRATAAPQAGTPVITSLGEGRLFPGSAWWHVTVDGEVLWANSRFLGMLGGDYDAFDDVSARLDGDVEDESIEALVERLRVALSADGPEVAATFVTNPDPGSGEWEVSVDMLGYGDDAITGERIVLSVSDETSSADAGVRLLEAQATLICSRGVAGDACV